MNKTKQLLIVGIVIIILIVIYLFVGNKNFLIQKTTQIQTPPPTTQEVSNPTSAPIENVSSGPTTTEIINALVAKHNWDISKVKVSIGKWEGDYASGGVSFTDEQGGGMWFAAKTNGNWQIVSDGNGVITCDSLTNYPNFPNSIIPECYNAQTNNVIKR
jgi:hypothetical protein